ncbi:hypothetical protein OSB04_018248 [Centaurea solstitialis]|uniref:Uncharacterized protein n=1 Tax=Centaurea solstitialis TaxID=347529 RepID=A0AA38T4G6_9ASTR|nr:hypothetical protein OSB04_018248 [Centaurea solstitialis]
MESNGFEHQEEESSVKKEPNNGDGKSKSGQSSYDINLKQLIDEAHDTVDYCITFFDHDMVKLKLYVDIIIDLTDEVKAEFSDELIRKNEDLMKSGSFGEREAGLRTGRPIQCVQMEPNENEILEEESSKKKDHNCTGRYCYNPNCKLRNALIQQVHDNVNECISLLHNDMVKLKRYVDEIIYLKSDIKAAYYDELRRNEEESEGIRKKRCKCNYAASDEKVIAESSKPKRKCKRCGEYARHDSRNCPLKYM